MWSGKLKLNPVASKSPSGGDVYKQLENGGQLVSIREGEDTSLLPPHVTHVRTPKGDVQRIRFA